MSGLDVSTTRTSLKTKVQWLGKSAWALADQMLISGTSFATMVLLARGLSSTTEFGAFVLVYSILLFINSLQSSLVTQPHNVLGVTRQGTDYVRYTSSSALHQLLIALVSGTLAIGLWGISKYFGWSEAPLLLALVPAIIAWQFQEFTRRVLYTERRISTAFVVDLLSYGGQLITISILWGQQNLTGSLALYAIAIASATSTIVGLWNLRKSLVLQWDLGSAKENWHFGKWLAGGEIIGNWVSGQFLIYLSAALLGVWAVGILRAVQTVFGPMRILAQAFCTTIPTRFARTLADHGQARFRKEVRTAFLVAIPILGAYCLIVAFLSGMILPLAFGEKFAGNENVLRAYSVCAFFGYLTMLLAATLRSASRTRQIFNCNLLVVMTVVPLSGFLIPLWGIYGVVAGMSLVNLTLLTLYFCTYRWTLLESASVSSSPSNSDEVGEMGIESGEISSRRFYPVPAQQLSVCAGNEKLSSPNV